MVKISKQNVDVEPPIQLTWAQVRAWRVQRHHLHQRVPQEAMLKVVSDLCGLHAQLMSSAELTLWCRVEGIGPETVEQALWQTRTLVKTWAMRGTLHLLPASEYPLWQAALGTYQHYLKNSWLRYFGFTLPELEALIAAIAKALDGKMLTRQELSDEVASLTESAGLGGKLTESWGAMLKPAAFRGHLCFAPNLGQNVRFTHPQSWLNGAGIAVEANEAMIEVMRRFLATYGPLTGKDFARWWGTTPAHATKLLEALAGEVTRVEVEGSQGWLLTIDVDEIKAALSSKTVRLLPAFDQYIIGATSHATNLMPGQFKERIYRPQGWVSPVLLVEGRMDGIWRHERKGNRLLVHIEPFVALPDWAQEAVQAETERLAALVGGVLELEWQE